MLYLHVFKHTSFISIFGFVHFLCVCLKKGNMFSLLLAINLRHCDIVERETGLHLASKQKVIVSLCLVRTSLGAQGMEMVLELL